MEKEYINTLKMAFALYLSDKAFHLQSSAKLFQLFLCFFMPLVYMVSGQRMLSIDSAWQHAKSSQPQIISQFSSHI